MNTTALFPLVVSVLLSPLLFGIINKTKAAFAGRQGPPILQLYFDIAKLLRKSAVYSHSTGFIFQIAPSLGLVASLMALTFIPMGGVSPLFSFNGDFIFVVYILTLAKFFMIISALETASAFEGMGASREAWFSVFAEPVLFIALVVLAITTAHTSFRDIYASSFSTLSGESTVAMMVAIMILFVILLLENARIPFDDPNTHLELTMIHEVMVLDNSGPDLALIHIASAFKLWLYSALIVGLCLPHWENSILNSFLFFLSIGMTAILIGIIESIMARLRLIHIPRLIISSGVIGLFAIALSLMK